MGRRTAAPDRRRSIVATALLWCLVVALLVVPSAPSATAAPRPRSRPPAVGPGGAARRRGAGLAPGRPGAVRGALVRPRRTGATTAGLAALAALLLGLGTLLVRGHGRAARGPDGLGPRRLRGGGTA